MANIDPKLYEYATPRQRDILESLERTGGGAATAAALGVDRSLPLRTLKAVQARMLGTHRKAIAASAVLA